MPFQQMFVLENLLFAYTTSKEKSSEFGIDFKNVQ